MKGRTTKQPSVAILVVFAVAVVLVVASVPALANLAATVTTVIDFEEYPDGTKTTDGTELTDQYEGVGVVFEVQEGESAGAIIEKCSQESENCESAASGSMGIITPGTGNEFIRKPLVIGFPKPQQEVSVAIQQFEWVNSPYSVNMTALDNQGNVIASTEKSFQPDTGWHSLQVETKADHIAQVEVTLKGPYVNYFVADDLAFGTNAPPSAEFEFSPNTPSTADTVTFTDKSSDSDGRIVSWQWDFADGSSSTSRNPTHSYADDGVYTVNLTVTDNEGETDSVEDVITVSNVAPIPAFTSSCSGDTCTFDGSRSSDSDGTVRYYVWDFGDGNVTNTTSPLVTHTFDSSGTYPVTLTVVDDDGDTGSAVHRSTVPSNIVPAIPPGLGMTAVGATIVLGIVALAGLFFRTNQIDNGTDGQQTGPMRVQEVHVRDSEDDDLNREYVVLKNEGDTTYVFEGETVSDGHENVYTVPSGFELPPSEEVTLYTGTGTDRQRELYWNKDEGVWETTDRVIIKDADEIIIDEVLLSD